MPQQRCNPRRISILISGRGSNMQAIHQSTSNGTLNAEVVNVVSSNPDAAGLAYATQHGIPATVVDHRKFGNKDSFDRSLAEKIDKYQPDFIALAGFMRILSAPFVDRYAGRLLNIHPSLLPRHPGLDTHRKAIECADCWHGCSVHFVSAELDGGPLIARSVVAILPGDSVESLSMRVLQQEHRLYPRVLGMCVRGELTWNDDSMLYKGAPLRYPLTL